MHLTDPELSAHSKLVELSDEQVHSFLVYATQAEDMPYTKMCGVPLPFKVFREARHLTIDQAVSENIYRDDGQLSAEWESNQQFERSRTLGWRADGTRGCVWNGPPKGSD